MLEFILINDILYYVMGTLFFIGVIIKIITSRTINKLAVEARDMSKSSQPFLKLVKSKYEHTSMVNNGVENVGIFVDKFLQEFKICGLTLHTWRRLKITIVLSIILAALTGVVLTYMQLELVLVAVSYATVGIATSLVLVGVYQMIDESYRISTVRIYMVDYLENVMAYRMERNNRKSVRPVQEERLSQVEKHRRATEENKKNVLTQQEVHKDTKQVNNTVDEELIEEYKIVESSETSTAGTSLKEASDVKEQQIQKIEMAKLLKMKVDEKLEQSEVENEESNSTIKLLESIQQGKVQLTNKTPNEALIRDILQEFMA